MQVSPVFARLNATDHRRRRRHRRHLGHARVHRNLALGPAPHVVRQVHHHVVHLSLCAPRLTAVLGPSRPPRPQARHTLRRRPLHRGRLAAGGLLVRPCHGRRPVHRRRRRRRGELRGAAVHCRGGTRVAPRAARHDECAVHHHGADGGVRDRVAAVDVRGRGHGLAVDGWAWGLAGRSAGCRGCLYARDAALACQGWQGLCREACYREGQRRGGSVWTARRHNYQGDRDGSPTRARGAAAEGAPTGWALEVARGLASALERGQESQSAGHSMSVAGPTAAMRICESFPKLAWFYGRRAHMFRTRSCTFRPPFSCSSASRARPSRRWWWP